MLQPSPPWKSLRAGKVLLALLCISALWVSLPRLFAHLGRAAALAGKPYSARRMAVMPQFYETVRNQRLSLPEQTSIAVVLARRQAIDLAVFVNYYLYPRRVRFFSALDQYRAAGDARPPILLYVDPTSGEQVRWMTYDEIRREQLFDARVVRSPQPSSVESRRLILPLAASLDGKPPEKWVTEAVFVSDTSATLTLRFHPFGESKRFELHPREPLILVDLVGEVFGGRRSGWIEATADQPMRAGAWLVERARNQATEVRLFDTVARGAHRVPAGDRLWLVNVDPVLARVTVDGHPVELPPSALVDVGPHRVVDVTASVPVIPFSSRRDRSGLTVFGWAEDLE